MDLKNKITGGFDDINVQKVLLFENKNHLGW